MDRRLWRSARYQGRSGRLGRADPFHRDAQLCAAGDGEPDRLPRPFPGGWTGAVADRSPAGRSEALRARGSPATAGMDGKKKNPGVRAGVSFWCDLLRSEGALNAQAAFVDVRSRRERRQTLEHEEDVVRHAEGLVRDATGIHELGADIEAGNRRPYQVGACTKFPIVRDTEHVAEGRGVHVGVIADCHNGAVEARAPGREPVVLEGRHDRAALLLLALVERRPDAIAEGRRGPLVRRRRSRKAVAVVERGGPETARVSEGVTGDVADSTMLVRGLHV